MTGPPIAPRRVAVVGAGVSGLVAAAELRAAGHDVHVFEAGAYAGGHSNTVGVYTERGRWEVDTGFIVFNERNYPNFERMLAELGVASQPADMSFSVSDGRGGFEWATNPRGVVARAGQAVDPRFHRMLRDLVRFNREARELIGNRAGGPSLRAFLAEGGYSDCFVERLLVPQASAVWSADPEQLWSMPAAFFAEFYDNHGVLQVRGRPRWRTVSNGSQRYVEALIAPFRDRVRLNAPVRHVLRHPDHVCVGLDDGSERFDEVVLAVHSDQALRLLGDPTDAEAKVLGAIPYQRNETVLHTDTSLMPRRRAAWASWNYHLTDEPQRRTTVTYHMNRLQSLVADREFLVTLNRTDAIDPGRVVRTVQYDHPVFTPPGIGAQERWAEISGARRTHYCGAYWRWGFHEDGVWSALRVSAALGGRGPIASPRDRVAAAPIDERVPELAPAREAA